MKHECPLCEKSYQSENKLDKHCQRIHRKTLKELKATANKLMSIGDFNGGESLGLG